MTSLATEVVADRLSGRRPSRMRALLVAGLAAASAGTLVYKLLRSTEAGDKKGDRDGKR